MFFEIWESLKYYHRDSKFCGEIQSSYA